MTIEQLRQDLQLGLAEADQERAITAQKEEQIRALQDALKKEKQMSKRFWREKCEQLLNYEEDLEAKDAEIALLKAQLITATASGRSGRNSVTPQSTRDYLQQICTAHLAVTVAVVNRWCRFRPLEGERLLR